MKGVKNWGSSWVIRQYGDYVYRLRGTKTNVTRLQSRERLDDLCECKTPCGIAFDKERGCVAISDGKYGRVVLYKQGNPHEVLAIIKLPCEKERYIGLEYDDQNACFLAGVGDSVYRFTSTGMSAGLVFKNDGSIFWGFSKSAAGVIAFLSGEDYERDAIIIDFRGGPHPRLIKCPHNEKFVMARHPVHYCDDGTLMVVAWDNVFSVLKLYHIRLDGGREIIQSMAQIPCNYSKLTNCSISPNKLFCIVMTHEILKDRIACMYELKIYRIKDGKLLFSERQMKYERAHFYVDSKNVYVSGSFSSILPIETFFNA